LKEKYVAHIEIFLERVALSPKSGKGQGFLNSIPKGSKPFELIHIDHYGIVDSSRAKKLIFVVVDGFTKFVRLYSTKSTSTREVITALKDYFRAYSRPKCIISDRGSSFTSKDFEEFMEEYNVKHIKIATGSLQANGQVKRINRSLGPIIAKLVDQSKRVYWDNFIDKI